MPETLVTDIADSLQAGADDTALDAVIQQHIIDWSLAETVAEWRIRKSADLRSWAYPPVGNYYAALASGDQAAMDQYNADYLAVDIRFPDALYLANPATTAEAEPYTMLADSTDTFTITGLPNPSIVTVTGPGIYPESGVWWERTTGLFVFRVDTPGQYVVTVASGGLYLDKTFTIMATEV
jgi:hypothetical protein